VKNTFNVSFVFSVLALVSVACSAERPTSKPATTGAAVETPAAADKCGLDAANAVPATAAQCECKGMRVVGDIGNGHAACPSGMNEVSKIRFGLEGGVCCAKAGTP
jgi:hypothetical protein